MAKSYLGLPPDDPAALPALLSKTGAFRATRTLEPGAGLIGYDLNAPFWSDGAVKKRWISVPEGDRIGFSPRGEWRFPAGTVFVKHFELTTDETHPRQDEAPRRRLETRLLLVDSAGGVYGASYKWREDETDAVLVTEPRREPVSIRTTSGTRAQVWYYPGPNDCRQCHAPSAGGVLGVKTRQINREFDYPGGVTDNQLRSWNRIGLFDPPVDEAERPQLPRLARVNDPGRSLEDRARSYLDANCAHCHRPGGVVADFDARYDTPLASQGLLGVPARINLAIDGARFIAPNDPWRSMVLMRVNTAEPSRMPPLARETIDREGAALLRAWVESLPGHPVAAPPAVVPRGGDYRGSVRVALEPGDPGVVVRYTHDGTAPRESSPAYQGPIVLRQSTTVRARAYRPGHTRSIAVQETFIVEE